MIRQISENEMPRLADDERARVQQQELLAEADRLYRTYGQPLEREHWGRYVAVSRDGRIVLGDTSREVLERALDAFGPENFVFKVGEIAIGKLR